MATIRDVAKKANVGLGTASRALSGTGYVAEAKRQRIFAAAEELGYTMPEKKPKAWSEEYKLIGVVIPDISLPFYGNFVKYADIELAKAGYKTVIYNTLGVQGRVSDAIELAEKGIVQGIIINADVTEEEQKRLEKLPTVSFERLLGKKIPYVTSEHRDGGRLVGEMLYNNRCKNVLIITAKHQTKVYAGNRIDECRQYLEQRGVKVTVVEFPASDVSLLVVKELARQYMDLYHDVDGIFSDDLVAYSCLQYARMKGIRVPEDLKIIGYDGNEVLLLSIPTLTTVKQDAALIAQTCVKLIERRIQGEKVENENLIPIEVVKGGTSF